jgi:DNA-binding CsgD family transcriptional regulator/tetratricopeptide (TPR) repeat protein
MGVLHAALEDALAGRGRLVMLVGEPGIGKTRTARELMGHAGQRGALVLWGRCHESSGAPPYWPWVQMLRAYMREQGTEHLQVEMGSGACDIATIVPEIRDQLRDLPLPPRFEDPEQARFRLFDAITLFLRRASQPHPLVLVLDNLHWADKPSLLLLEFLASELDDCRLLVLGTYRDVEVSRQHPLSETLGELRRERPLQRVLLRGLSRQEVGHFIAVATGLAPFPALVEAVYAQTEGNPLFLTEMVRFLVQEGAIEPERFLASSQPMGLPEGIRDVIGKRLNRLSQSCNQLLTMAAVIGREFDLQEVSTLYDAGSEEHVLTLLEEAVTARVIEEVPQTRGHFQFTHALIRATLYDELSLARRVLLHRQIGETLEAHYSSHLDPHLAQLAYHFGEAAEGETLEKAIDYAVQAGERANAMLAYEEAARYYTMALQACERQDNMDETRHTTLLLALGHAQCQAGDVSCALETFQRAADLAKQLGSAESLAHAALGFEETSWRPGLPGDAAVRLLEDALAMLGEGDTPLKARVLGSLGRARAFTGAFEQAMAVEQQAVEMARRIGDPATLAATLKARFFLRFWPQHVASRLASANELLRLAEETGDRETVLLAYAWRLFDLMELGDMPEVDRQLDAHLHLAEELRQPFYLYVHVTFQAMRAIFAGQFAEGERLAQEALNIGQRLRGQDALGVYGVQMFTLRREQGRLQEVAPVVKHFVQTSPETSAWTPGLALIYSELGLEQEAREEFEQLAVDDFARIPQDARWVTCMTYLAEVCAFLGDTRRAAILYQCLLPYDGYTILIGPTAACYGAASRYLGMLAATMTRWDEAQGHFEAALAMNARMGAKPWLAHTQHEYATMLLARNQSGDSQRAGTLLAEALATSRALGMHTLEERVIALQERVKSQAPKAPAYPCGLSQREVDVLRLIAAGKSNREIADTLFISSNTVANHVRNILTKTHTANRTEAAAFAIHAILPHCP